MKTAFFASDPNLGRILARSATPASTTSTSSRVDLYLDDVLVAKSGGRAPRYQEADGQRVMKQSEITVRVVLDRGTAAATCGPATSRTTTSASTPTTAADADALEPTLGAAR